MIRRTARPMVALARFPDPKAFGPPFMPTSAASGPLTTMSGEATWVVACTPLRLNARSVSASIAARTIGAYSGRQPAITMLIASISRVSAPQRGATLHSTNCGSPPSAATTASIFSWVGGKSVRPSAFVVKFDEIRVGRYPLDGGRADLFQCLKCHYLAPAVSTRSHPMPNPLYAKEILIAWIDTEIA